MTDLAPPPSLTLVVLAAGMGSRFGGDKQFAPLGPDDTWLVDFALFDAWRAGFARALFVIRPDLDLASRSSIEKRYSSRLPVQFAEQHLNDVPFPVPADRIAPWGTAHAVWAARDSIDGPFLVVNADDFYGLGAYEKAARFLSETVHDGTALALVSYPLSATLSASGPVNRAACATSGGMLVGIEEITGVEKRDEEVIGQGGDGAPRRLAPLAPVSMNMWGLKPSFFQSIEREWPHFVESGGSRGTSELRIPDVIDRWIHTDTGTVRVLTSDSRWFGITYPKDVALAEREIHDRLENSEYPRGLWSAPEY